MKSLRNTTGSLLGLPVFLLLLMGGLFWRGQDLDRRVLHTDEAVQAVKFGELLEEGAYAYDPQEYHGPVLYYASLPLCWLRGIDQIADVDARLLRSVPLLFATLGLGLLLLLRNGLGRGGSLAALALALLSPLLAYYSRYYIQESLFATFSLGLLACGWRYVQRPSIGWALGLGAFAGLLHASKETCVILFFALAVSLMLSLWLRKDRPRLQPHLLPLGAAVLCGLLLSALFYSSFFTNGKGPIDSLLAYFNFVGRAGGEGHEKAASYYLSILFGQRAVGNLIWSEALVVVPGLAAWLYLALRRSRIQEYPLVFFAGTYALITLAVHFAIPYKTPWLLCAPVLTLALPAGWGVAQLIQHARPLALRVFLLAPLAVAAWQSAGQIRQANGRFAADERNPFAYSHTSSDLLRLPARMEALSELHPEGKAMLIQVMAPEVWPLPWYLRSFERVGFWSAPPEQIIAPVIISSPEFADELDARLQPLGPYQIEMYGLRPGVILWVYIQQDLWDQFMQQNL